jgi:hypothetical protein
LEEQDYPIGCRVSDPASEWAADTVWVTVYEAILQQYLFEYSYVYHVWGHREEHYYVDRWGDVHRYTPDRSGWREWAVCPDDHDPCLGEHYELFYSSPEYVETVDREALLEHYRLIETASEGEITDRLVGCFDVGTWVFHALHKAAGDSVYQRVPVLSQGETAWFNRSEEGKRIYHFLNQVFCDGNEWDCMHPEWDR